MYRNIMLPKRHHQILQRLSWFRHETITNTVVEMIEYVSSELKIYSPGCVCATCQDSSICDECVFNLEAQTWI